MRYSSAVATASIVGLASAFPQMLNSRQVSNILADGGSNTPNFVASVASSQAAVAATAVAAPGTTARPDTLFGQANLTAPGVNHQYIAPGPNDSRGPCPGLNTLANHGYLNRDGRNMPRQQIIDAFNQGWGIGESVVDLPLTNAFAVCEYTTGAPCENLANLTLLAEPHTFEHDGSFSRLDYYNSTLGAGTDNLSFNPTIFQESLNVLNGSSHMTIAQCNQIRQVRNSNSLQQDVPGNYISSVAVNTGEAGFIFAVMADFGLPNFNNDPQVRVDWWNYWFTNESFPEPLGWMKPNPVRENSFVTSVSAAILAATATSTPAILAANVANTVGPVGLPLPAAPTVAVEPVPSVSPYVATAGNAGLSTVSNPAPATAAFTNPPSGALKARQAAPTGVEAMTSAMSMAGPMPTPMNFYQQSMAVSDIANQKAAIASWSSAVQSNMAIITGGA